MAKIEIRTVDLQHTVLIFFATFFDQAKKSREAKNYIMVRNISQYFVLCNGCADKYNHTKE